MPIGDALGTAEQSRAVRLLPGWSPPPGLLAFSPVHLGLRKLLMGSLVAAFCGQTAMVYLDDTAENLPKMSPLGVQGRRLWHEHNCQVCHQIYGFGGFLGPDLTNAIQRLSRARLDEMLTKGNAQMPAFHFDSEQIDAIETFLGELSDTGIGVARSAPPLDARTVLTALDAEAAERRPPEAAARGLLTFKSQCTTCHVPLQATALGFNTAPDQSMLVDRLDDATIRSTIVQGRLQKGMPAWPMLNAAAVDDLVAFFHWLRDERDAIVARLPESAQPQGLPWWEFK